MNILLHICCSNCALYPVKLLREEHHSFTGFWFNPNIHPLPEYDSRLASLKKLSDLWHIDVMYDEEYRPDDYFRALDITDKDLLNRAHVNDREHSAETGLNAPPAPDRCRACYRLRLEKTAEEAQRKGFDAFSTTLLISPYQDFEEIIRTGKSIADTFNIEFHVKDYRPYFRDAMNLAKDMALYRQNYCGCIFSKEERLKAKEKGTKAHSNKGAK